MGNMHILIEINKFNIPHNQRILNVHLSDWPHLERIIIADINTILRKPGVSAGIILQWEIDQPVSKFTMYILCDRGQIEAL